MLVATPPKQNVPNGHATGTSVADIMYAYVLESALLPKSVKISVRSAVMFAAIQSMGLYGWATSGEATLPYNISSISRRGAGTPGARTLTLKDAADSARASPSVSAGKAMRKSYAAVPTAQMKPDGH